MHAREHLARREHFIEQHLQRVTCLRGFETRRVLGRGTVGTVFLVCERGLNATACYAAKIQVLSTKNEERLFQREVEAQNRFAPRAPLIRAYCVDAVPGAPATGKVGGKSRLATLVMELTHQTLDRRLSKELSREELQQVVQDVASLLKFAAERRLVHGDSALFNLAYVQRKGRSELVFIDFDRASVEPHVTQRFPHLDALRLISELHEGTRSRGTAPLHPANLRFLRAEAPKVWRAVVGLRKMSPGEMDEAWTSMYCAYCRVAAVLCLPEQECERLAAERSWKEAGGEEAEVFAKTAEEKTQKEASREEQQARVSSQRPTTEETGWADMHSATHVGAVPRRSARLARQAIALQQLQTHSPRTRRRALER